MFGQRVLQLLIGLFLYGFAMGVMVRAAVGVEPWDVLSLGIQARTGIPFGVLTNAIGLAVLLLWLPLRQRPGLGTVLNVMLLGPSSELALAVVPQPDAWWWRAALFAAGLILLGIASGLYIGAGLGPGPRDGLMIGLHHRLGWPLWAARSVIEVSVFAVGWALGGDVGLGTIASALLIGPIVQVTVRRLTLPRPDVLRPGAVLA